jgi:hypothetical protein
MKLPSACQSWHTLISGPVIAILDAWLPARLICKSCELRIVDKTLIFGKIRVQLMSARLY